METNITSLSDSSMKLGDSKAFSAHIRSKEELSLAMPSAIAQCITPLHHLLHVFPMPELALSAQHTNTEPANINLDNEEQESITRKIQNAAEALYHDEKCQHFLHSAFEHEREKASSAETTALTKKESNTEETNVNNKIVRNIADNATNVVCNWLDSMSERQLEKESQSDYQLECLHSNKEKYCRKRRRIAEMKMEALQKLERKKNSVLITNKETVAEEATQNTLDSLTSSNTLVNEQSNANINKADVMVADKMLSEKIEVESLSSEQKTNCTDETASLKQEENASTVQRENTKLTHQESKEVLKLIHAVLERKNDNLQKLHQFVKLMTIARSPFAEMTNEEEMTMFIHYLLEEYEMKSLNKTYNDKEKTKEWCKKDKELTIKQEELEQEEEEEEYEQQEKKVSGLQSKINSIITITNVDSNDICSNCFTYRHALCAQALLWVVIGWHQHLLASAKSLELNEEQTIPVKPSTNTRLTKEKMTYTTENMSILQCMTLSSSFATLRNCIIEALIDAFYQITHHTHRLMSSEIQKITKCNTLESSQCTSSVNELPLGEKNEDSKLEIKLKTEKVLGKEKTNLTSGSLASEWVSWYKWAELIRTFAQCFTRLLETIHNNAQEIACSAWLFNKRESEQVKEICTYALFSVPTLCDKSVYIWFASYVTQSILQLYSSVWRFQYDDDEAIENINVAPQRFFTRVFPSSHLLQQTWSEMILICFNNNTLTSSNSNYSKVNSDVKELRFSLFTIYILTALQSLPCLSSRFLLLNRQCTSIITKDAYRLQAACAGWANALWSHFLFTPTIEEESKEMLTVRCNVVISFFKELSMLLNCPAWPAAQVLLRECVNVFSHNLRASIITSVSKSTKNNNTRTTKRRLQVKPTKAQCFLEEKEQYQNKELYSEEQYWLNSKHKQEEEQQQQQQQKKASTKQKSKNVLKLNRMGKTVNKKEQQCINAEHKRVQQKVKCEDNKEESKPDNGISKSSKIYTWLQIAVIDAIAEVTVQLIMMRAPLLSMYSDGCTEIKNVVAAVKEMNSSYCNRFESHFAEFFKSLLQNSKLSHILQNKMPNMKQKNYLDVEVSNKTENYYMESAIRFVYNALNQINRYYSLPKRSNKSDDINKGNELFYQHLLSWILCDNNCELFHNVNDSNDENIDVDDDDDDDDRNEIENSESDKHTIHISFNILDTTLRAVDSKEDKMNELLSECGLSFTHLHAEKPKILKVVKESVNKIVQLINFTLPLSMISQTTEEQLIQFLLSLLQCSCDANKSNYVDTLFNDQFHRNSFHTTSTSTNTTINSSNKNNKNDNADEKLEVEMRATQVSNNEKAYTDTLMIADSIVKRVIYHLTRLCMCNKEIVYFIWWQVKSYVRNSNARIREAVIPLITVLIQTYLTNVQSFVRICDHVEESLLEHSRLENNNANVREATNTTRMTDFITEMISTLLLLLEDKSIMVVSRVISSFNTILVIFDHLTDHVITYEENRHTTSVGVAHTGMTFMPAAERDQLVQFIQYKLLKCFASSEHERHKGDIIHLFMKRWLRMLNVDANNICTSINGRSSLLANTSISSSSSSSSLAVSAATTANNNNILANDNNNDERNIANQLTFSTQLNRSNTAPTAQHYYLPSNSSNNYVNNGNNNKTSANTSLSSCVLAAHAQLAREWTTLTVKLTGTTANSAVSNATMANGFTNTTNTMKTVESITASTLSATLPLQLPTITKEHPFVQLLSLMLSKASRSVDRQLSKRTSSKIVQASSLCFDQDDIDSATLANKDNFYNDCSNYNKEEADMCSVYLTDATNHNHNHTKKKNNGFTVMEVEHILRSISRALWTRFTCCVSAEDAFNCLMTLHVIAMVNANSVCKLIPEMIPYLSLSSEQNGLRHSSSEMRGGVLLLMCQILQTILIDIGRSLQLKCNDAKLNEHDINKSHVLIVNSTPYKESYFPEKYEINHSVRSEENDNNNNNIISNRVCHSLTATTLDAMSTLLTSIIAKYVGAFQQRIIVAACGALTALIPFGEFQSNIKNTRYMQNTRLGICVNATNTINNNSSLSSYQVLCYDLMNSYYCRIKSLLPTLTTDPRSVLYIQRFLFLLSEFLRNYRGWASKELQERLHRASNNNKHNNHNWSKSSSNNNNCINMIDKSNIDENNSLQNTLLPNDTTSQIEQQQYTSSQNGSVSLCDGDGICSNVFALVEEVMQIRYNCSTSSPEVWNKLELIMMRVMSSLCILDPRTYFVQCERYITHSLEPHAPVALHIQGLTLLRDFLRDEAERVSYASSANSPYCLESLEANTTHNNISNNDNIITSKKINKQEGKENVIIGSVNAATKLSAFSFSSLETIPTLEVQSDAKITKCKFPTNTITTTTTTTTTNNNNNLAYTSNKTQKRKKRQESTATTTTTTITTTAGRKKMRSEQECAPEENERNKARDAFVKESITSSWETMKCISSRFDVEDENSGMAAWLMQKYHESICTLCIYSISKAVRQLCLEILNICAKDGLLPPMKYLTTFVAICNDADGEIRAQGTRFLHKSTELIQCNESLLVAAVPGILRGYILASNCEPCTFTNCNSTNNNIIESMCQRVYCSVQNNSTELMPYDMLFSLLSYRERQKIRSTLLRHLYEDDKLTSWWKCVPLIRHDYSCTFAHIENKLKSSNNTQQHNNDINASEEERYKTDHVPNLPSFAAYLSIVITLSSLSSVTHSELVQLCNECVTGISLHGESALEVLTSVCDKLVPVESDLVLEKLSLTSSEGGVAKTRKTKNDKNKSKAQTFMQQDTNLHKQSNLYEEQQQLSRWEQYEQELSCTPLEKVNDDTNAAHLSAKSLKVRRRQFDFMESISLEKLFLSEAIGVILLHYIYNTVQNFYSLSSNQYQSHYSRKTECLPVTSVNMQNTTKVVNMSCNTNSNNNNSSSSSGYHSPLTVTQVQIILTFLHKICLFTNKLALLAEWMQIDNTENTCAEKKECIDMQYQTNMQKSCDYNDEDFIAEITTSLQFLRNELQKVLNEDNAIDAYTAFHNSHSTKRKGKMHNYTRKKKTLPRSNKESNKANEKLSTSRTRTLNKRSTQQVQRKRKRSVSESSFSSYTSESLSSSTQNSENDIDSETDYSSSSASASELSSSSSSSSPE